MPNLWNKTVAKTTISSLGRGSLGIWACALVILGSLHLAACQSNDLGTGSTEPLNDSEKVEYHRALNRCLKSGGSRIVKVLNQLRCY
jgi:hypothetical protein